MVEGGSLLPWLLGIGLLAAVVALLIRRSMRNRRRSPGRMGQDSRGGSDPSGPGGPHGTSAPGQAHAPVAGPLDLAEAELVDADNALRRAEQVHRAMTQELESSPTEFQAARMTLDEAFALHRMSADPVAHTTADRILELAQTAVVRLDEHSRAVDTQIDLERTCDTVLPALGAQGDVEAVRVQSCRGTLDTLRTRYPGNILAAAERNLEHAGDRLDLVAESVRAGLAALAGGDRSTATAHARTAQESLGQAATLLDNVEWTPEVMAAAEASMSALLEQTDRDLGNAALAGPIEALETVQRFTTEIARWARQAIASGGYDPIAVRRTLEESDTALSATLAQTIDEDVAIARAVALLPTITLTAAAAIRFADDVIGTRRAAVGVEARSRLAEARVQEAAGLAAATSDPVAALAHLQAADHLADQAHTLTQADEARFRNAVARSGGTSGARVSNLLSGIDIPA